ncbi:hypothetical protein AK812_SmicGene44242 [Symbiodinium microadriaticum]|uniref:Uncharacterized protein n=1 Tax=Symbiodinium microadriaticum TaxID=2951 RepID=A0A1Q9BYZ1_SYMMI|nr:hypothetical protein AK812_SmicGene44242 [Symbiodinium microadriaticum]
MSFFGLTNIETSGTRFRERTTQFANEKRRLQLLIDGNYINYRGGDRKLRLQFLGVRLAPSPNPQCVRAGEPAFSHRIVDMETQYQELRCSQDTQNLRQEHLEQTANWVKPWAIRASSGHTRCRATIMELDPSKFALSAPLTLPGQIQGAYHATEHYNLNTIMNEGIKTGRDMIGQCRTSGRLHSYWGVFPAWDPRNKVTRNRSTTDQRTPLVTLYIPIIDLVRAGGRVTESGAIMCDRTLPFYLVKEMWLCIPGNDQSGGFRQVEKILDYELEDKICTDYDRPLTQTAKEMYSYRNLERLLELLCEMPSGPHDGMKAEIVSRRSEYYGADWSETDWNVYDEQFTDAVNFLIISFATSQGSKNKQGPKPLRICPWCLSNTPSCLSRCALCFRYWYLMEDMNESKAAPMPQWRFLEMRSLVPGKKRMLFLWKLTTNQWKRNHSQKSMTMATPTWATMMHTPSLNLKWNSTSMKKEKWDQDRRKKSSHGNRYFYLMWISTWTSTLHTSNKGSWKHSRKGNDMTLLATGDIYPKSTLTLVYLEMSMMKKFLSLEEIEGKTMTLWEITSSVDSEPTRLSPNFFVVQSNSVTIDSKSRSTTTCVKAKTSRHQWCIPVAKFIARLIKARQRGELALALAFAFDQWWDGYQGDRHWDRDRRYG